MSAHEIAADGGAAQRKRIWLVFWIMAAITVAEFAIAFAMERGTGRNLIFIVMTIVKAYFIVAEFMHLKHEAKELATTILIPLIFVCWLLLALLIEGSYIHNGWFAFLNS